MREQQRSKNIPDNVNNCMMSTLSIASCDWQQLDSPHDRVLRNGNLINEMGILTNAHTAQIESSDI